MFSVQMSLEYKKAEILKLHETAAKREEALKKANDLLERDVHQFDAFLQANDAKANRALKEAEELAMVKQEKGEEIKMLKASISRVDADIAKLQEQKEECDKFQDFLLKLTPPEWLEEQRRILEERREAKLKAKTKLATVTDVTTNRKITKVATTLGGSESKSSLPLAVGANDVDDVPKATQAQRSDLRNNGAEENEKTLVSGDDRSEKKASVTENLDENGQDEDENIDEEEETLPVYFTQPKQILDILSDLEEQNLFLIQNVQQTEQALEDVEARFRETRKVMGMKEASLATTISGLQSEASAAERRAQEAALAVRDPEQDQQTSATEATLKAAVHDFFKTCAFHTDQQVDPDDTAQLLEIIEVQVEGLLNRLDDYQRRYPELVARLERDLEKERREGVRQEKATLQTVKYEQRLKVAMRRATDQTDKRPIGKKIMQRSNPGKLEMAKSEQVNVNDAAAELEHRLFFS
eukprot:GHVT01047831.1.p1 GENE.GHVT01047831.1~~GHVT01047831.1.p1  ORF type:complete len:469 (+),score=100.90 GHVT01047831.1:203-1609(+)